MRHRCAWRNDSHRTMPTHPGLHICLWPAFASLPPANYVILRIWTEVHKSPDVAGRRSRIQSSNKRTWVKSLPHQQFSEIILPPQHDAFHSCAEPSPNDLEGNLTGVTWGRNFSKVTCVAYADDVIVTVTSRTDINQRRERGSITGSRALFP
jgi:hypothetical protein